jgi:hypothetical protein
MEDVPRAEAATEVPMFPRMIQMVVGIVASGIMAHPVPVRMYVRSVRMSRSIPEIGRLGCAMFLRPGQSLLARGRRTMWWNEPSILMRRLAFASLAIRAGCADTAATVKDRNSVPRCVETQIWPEPSHPVTGIYVRQLLGTEQKPN